jgi:hypothetical protein
MNKEEWPQSRLARYLEVDFPEITLAKINSIQRQPELSSVIGEFTTSGDLCALYC